MLFPPPPSIPPLISPASPSPHHFPHLIPPSFPLPRLPSSRGSAVVVSCREARAHFTPEMVHSANKRPMDFFGLLKVTAMVVEVGVVVVGVVVGCGLLSHTTRSFLVHFHFSGKGRRPKSVLHSRR